MGDDDMEFMEQAEGILLREKSILWQCERQIRMRCDGLTTLEIKALRKNTIWDGQTNCFNDAEKVQTFFGHASGGTAACKRLLKRCYEYRPCEPGKAAMWSDVEFTLGKHLLLSERKQQKLKEDQPQHIMPCKCFAATYVMPGGCIHNKQLLWKASSLQSTLCPTCSTCLRCGLLPI